MSVKFALRIGGQMHDHKNFSDSNAEKSKASDWAMVILTFLTAIAAFISAWLFQEQLIETRRLFRLDERAWVELEPVSPSGPEAVPEGWPVTYRYDLRVKNVGKTVASDVFLRLTDHLSTSEIGSDNKEISKVQEDLLKSASQGERRNVEGNVVGVVISSIPLVLAPNSAAPVTGVITAVVPKVKIEGPYKSGTYDYVIGRVDYLDTFKVKHWMTFCFVVADDKGNLKSCIFGNNEDENEPRT
jgi:hypothetical protein